jgi:peptide subunit release factor 1 (eRF1)
VTNVGTESRLLGDRIADLRSHQGALISLYASRPSPGGFGALLSELVKPLRERSGDRDRRVQKSIRVDTERIHDLADRLEMYSAPGFAIFASDIDGIFVLEPLDHPAPNVATIGPRPYMRPLRAMPRPSRSGILVADRTTARTFTAVEGTVDELHEAIGVDVGKRSWGGFSGYDELTVRSRADEATARLWREAGERLLERHMERSFDYLAIGAQEEMVEEIARILHPYLAKLPRESFTATPQTLQPARLRVEVAAMDQEMRRRRHVSLAGRVCDTAWSGGNAVLGLSDVLAAANALAIDALVVAGPFTRPGTLCDDCGHLARSGENCPVCGSVMFHVDDLVGALMEATVSAGGSVHQITVASPLDREDVGALTRFPVSV